jgi:hypothetical protein
MCMSPHCCVYIVPLHEGFTLIYILWMVMMGLDEFTIIYRLWFFMRGIETGHIIWLCMAGVGWRAAGGYPHRFSYNLNVPSEISDHDAASSIYVVAKPHLWRWSYREWSRAHAQPKVTSPVAAMTGTGSHGSMLNWIKWFVCLLVMLTYAWNDLLCHIFNNIMCMSPHCCVYIVPLHEGSDMIDALVKRVSVTYKYYEMYAHRGKKVQMLVF